MTNEATGCTKISHNFVDVTKYITRQKDINHQRWTPAAKNVCVSFRDASNGISVPVYDITQL
jgi:hypothetical protein